MALTAGHRVFINKQGHYMMENINAKDGILMDFHLYLLHLFIFLRCDILSSNISM